MASKFFDVSTLPIELDNKAALKAAYHLDLEKISGYLKNESVFITCEREIINNLVELIEDNIRSMLNRKSDSTQFFICDGVLGGPNNLEGIPRMVEQFMEFSDTRDSGIIVIPFFDLLTTTTNSSLTDLTKNIQYKLSRKLYLSGKEVRYLAFCSPEFSIPESLRQLFDRQMKLGGVDRSVIHRLVTQDEARRIDLEKFDSFGIYSYLAGHNPVRIRKILSMMKNDFMVCPPGCNESKSVYSYLQKTNDGIELPNVNSSDIAGYDYVKENLEKEILSLYRRINETDNVEKIKSIEEILPRGIIFHGPPGTGKTFFAKYLATQLEASLIVVNGPELKSKWLGESEENVRKIFDRARKSAPCVIVFDEMDSLAPVRGKDTSTHNDSIVNQLLTEMDGFKNNQRILCIATTNRPELIDPALRRPGRFQTEILISGPNKEERREIIKLYNKKFKVGISDHLIEFLVKKTEEPFDLKNNLPYAGDHISGLVKSILRHKLYKNISELTVQDIEEVMNPKRVFRKLSEAEERIIAVHEMGHYISGKYSDSGATATKITIDPGMPEMFGYVQNQVKSEPSLFSKEQLFGQLVSCMGGRAAEVLFNEGKITPGASQDFYVAERIARDMIYSLGMGSRHRFYDPEFLTPTLRSELESEISDLLHKAFEKAKEIIKDHQEEYNQVLQELLIKKTIYFND